MNGKTAKLLRRAVALRTVQMKRNGEAPPAGDYLRIAKKSWLEMPARERATMRRIVRGEVARLRAELGIGQ